MQARKRKLEELKRLQAEGQPQVSMEEMKQENDKLNKQVRSADLRPQQRIMCRNRCHDASGCPPLPAHPHSYPSCFLIEQARIEQRARELLQQNQGGDGKGVSELVVEGGGPADGPAVVTDAELDAELQKIATLDLDAVREEQQKYMKEKRGLNIARRTWYGQA